MQGRAEQVSNISNKVHQTTYKPLFSTLYMDVRLRIVPFPAFGARFVDEIWISFSLLSPSPSI